MKILSTNLIDSASLTGSSEDISFPASNMQDSMLASVWRTTGITSENVVINLGTAQSADIVFVANHNFTSSVTLTLEGNSSDSWGAPPFSESLTYSSGIISKAFTSASYQYWRLTIADTTNSASYLKIGGLGLGAAYDYPGLGTDYSVENFTSAKKYISDGGQVYGSAGIQWRRISAQIPYVTAAERVTIESFFASVDWFYPVFVQFDETVISENALYATLNDNSMGFQVLQTIPVAYSSRITWEEAL